MTGDPLRRWLASVDNEDARFRAWLRTIDELPADVPGDDAWNLRSAEETFRYVTPELEM